MPPCYSTPRRRKRVGVTSLHPACCSAHLAGQQGTHRSDVTSPVAVRLPGRFASKCRIGRCRNDLAPSAARRPLGRRSYRIFAQRRHHWRPVWKKSARDDIFGQRCNRDRVEVEILVRRGCSTGHGTDPGIALWVADKLQLFQRLKSGFVDQCWRPFRPAFSSNFVMGQTVANASIISPSRFAALLS